MRIVFEPEFTMPTGGHDRLRDVARRAGSDRAVGCRRRLTDNADHGYRPAGFGRQGFCQ